MLNEIKEVLEVHYDLLNEKRNSENYSKIKMILNFLASKALTQNYILLVANPRNIRDAKILSGIEGAKLINEVEKPDLEYGVSNLLTTCTTADEALDMIKAKTIIIKDNEAVKEFHKLMRVSDTLTNSNKRYLTRRVVDFPNWNIEKYFRSQVGKEIKKISNIDMIACMVSFNEFFKINMVIKKSIKSNETSVKEICKIAMKLVKEMNRGKLFENLYPQINRITEETIDFTFDVKYIDLMKRVAKYL